MLIVPAEQAQAIYEEQPLRQQPETEPPRSVQPRLEYQVLQEDDGEIE